MKLKQLFFLILYLIILSSLGCMAQSNGNLISGSIEMALGDSMTLSLYPGEEIMTAINKSSGVIFLNPNNKQIPISIVKIYKTAGRINILFKTDQLGRYNVRYIQVDHQNFKIGNIDICVSEHIDQITEDIDLTILPDYFNADYIEARYGLELKSNEKIVLLTHEIELFSDQKIICYDGIQEPYFRNIVATVVEIEKETSVEKHTYDGYRKELNLPLKKGNTLYIKYFLIYDYKYFILQPRIQFEDSEMLFTGYTIIGHYQP